ncbi:MAG: hypothetical protein AB7N91_09045 [Candidatus Tectimicrobiota bacterium]
MCVLCWQTVAEAHWTEQSLEQEDSPMGLAGSARERDRRRDRQHRTQVLNHLLRHYGLRLDDWQHRSYMLSDRKGKTLLVQDLGALWPAAQQLAGRSLDPLDPVLLAALAPQRTGEPTA